MSQWGDWANSFAHEVSQADELWSSPSSAPSDGSRYELISVLGEGGMGRVWLGWDHRLARNVAIKEPLGDGNSPQTHRLRREIMLTARIEHPGVVAIHDSFERDGKPMFVMALVRGLSLAEHLAQMTLGDQYQSRQALIRYLIDVCEVVGYTHQFGVLHRDLTPHNILIEEDGSARIIDWGMAVMLDEVKAHNPPVGTPGFISPEQHQGGAIDTRTDVWSLGAILHVILRGHPPTSDTTLTPTSAIEFICHKALDPDPSHRYADAGAMAQDLLRWFEGRRIDAMADNPVALVAWLAKRYRVHMTVAAAILLLFATSIAVGVWRSRRAEHLAIVQKRAAERARKRADREALQARRSNVRLKLLAARDALERGEVRLARQLVKQLEQTGESQPEVLGLRMQLGLIPQLTRDSTYRLPKCEGRWILTTRMSLQLCRTESVIEAWGNQRLVWRVDMLPLLKKHYNQNLRIVEWRIDKDYFYGLANSRGVFQVALADGSVKVVVPEQVSFGSRHTADKILRVDRLGWLDSTKAHPCPKRIVQVDQVDQHMIYICHDGSVLRGDGKVLYSNQMDGVHHYAYIPITKEYWVYSSSGLVWPLGEFNRHVRLTLPVKRIQALERTPYLLVESWQRTWRIFDTIQGDWLASFEGDIHDVRAVGHRQLQVARAGRLERYTLPDHSAIRVFRSSKGLTDVAWSDDDQVLSVTGAGAMVQFFEPWRGLRYRPRFHSNGVMKSVSWLPGKGFVSVASLADNSGTLVYSRKPRDQNQWENVTLTDVWHGGGRRVEVMADGSIVALSASRGLFRFSPKQDGTWRREFLARNVSFVDLNVDRAKQNAIAVSKRGVHLFDLKGGHRVWPTHDAQYYYGAIGEQGQVAVSNKAGWVLLDGNGRPIRKVQSSRVMSILWRGPHVITGHLNGLISIWDSRTGQRVALVDYHDGRVSSLALSGDEQTLASTSWDNTMRLLSFAPFDGR